MCCVCFALFLAGHSQLTMAEANANPASHRPPPPPCWPTTRTWVRTRTRTSVLRWRCSTALTALCTRCPPWRRWPLCRARLVRWWRCISTSISHTHTRSLFHLPLVGEHWRVDSQVTCNLNGFHSPWVYCPVQFAFCNIPTAIRACALVALGFSFHCYATSFVLVLVRVAARARWTNMHECKYK